MSAPAELLAAGARRAARRAADWVDLQWSLLERSLRAVAPRARGRLLDVGCGEKPYEAWFRPHVDSVLGGPRLLAQAEESLDLCIAQKQREVPSLQQFFAPFQPAPRR